MRLSPNLLLIEADAVVQGISPDGHKAAAVRRKTPGQDRSGLPSRAVHRLDRLQVLVGAGDHGKLPRRRLVSNRISQVYAVKADRYQHAKRIHNAVQHVLPATRQLRGTEAESLLDLDRSSKLAALRVIAGAAHFLVEGAAEVGNHSTAFPRGKDESRGDLRRILRANLVLGIQ